MGFRVEDSVGFRDFGAGSFFAELAASKWLPSNSCHVIATVMALVTKVCIARYSNFVSFLYSRRLKDTPEASNSYWGPWMTTILNPLGLTFKPLSL